MLNELEKLKLKASLRKAIENWTQANDNKLVIYWGDKTIDLMTENAFSIIETIEDYENCAKREGWYVE